MPRDDEDDYDDRPRRRRRDDDEDDRPRRRGRRGTPCPECGSEYQHAGPWPWYLGTVGMMFCKAVVCDDCGHHFDAKKPHANLASRKRNLAIAINGVGLLGIILVIGCLGFWLASTMNPR
jgi:hypothetical protein